MDYIKLDNFRVFAKPVEFKLAPITFLTGKNNAGKSSLIKSLLLLSDFLTSENDQTTLNFNDISSNKHKINNFGNAINWNSEDLNLSISFEQNDYKYEFIFFGLKTDDTALLLQFTITSLEIQEELILRLLSENEYEIKASQKFFDFVAGRRPVSLFDEDEIIKQIEEIKQQIKVLNDQKKKMLHEKNLMVDILSEKQKLQTRLKLLTNQVKNTTPNQEKTKHIYQTTIEIKEEDFANLSIPSIIRKGFEKYFVEQKKSNRESDLRILFKLYDILRSRLKISIEHLGPNRFYQSRLYFKQNNFSEINEVLFKYAVNKPKAGSEGERFLEKWLLKFGLGKGIDVEIIEGNSCRIQLIQTNKTYINISDMGFGPGQLLTIILCLTNIINRKTSIHNRGQVSAIDSLVLIEEPEANLHPAFQSLLLELFLEVNNNYGISFIIETHSEYLIRNTQVKVKEIGKDHPFKVYYFDNNKGPYEMKYREDGIFENDFGSGFFDESANLTFELI